MLSRAPAADDHHGQERKQGQNDQHGPGPGTPDDPNLALAAGKDISHFVPDPELDSPFAP